MSAADAGTKQIGMAVDVPKPLETKNTESGKGMSPSYLSFSKFNLTS